MSFILDALKKSESDRQTQGQAEFAGVPTRPQNSSVPAWIWLVALLLVINLVVLVGLLMRSDPVANEAPVPMTTAPESPPSGPPAQASITSQEPATESSSATDFAERVATARQNRPQAQDEAAAQETTPVANTVTPVVISQDPATIPAGSIYPTYQEVIARGTVRLPPLHLDIHVFSPEPNDRFVFINMDKLREGSTMSAGPEVAEITTDGVVLRYDGQMFLLPRD